MGRKKTGTVVTNRQGLFQPQVTFACGSRKLLAPFKKGTSRAMAKEKTAALQEQITAEGLRLEQHREHRPPPSASWVERWLEDRRSRGMTSVRENDSHWRHHIEPVLGARSPEDWRASDFRELCRRLDSRVQKGEISWKTAVNIWASATRMAADCAFSKDDALRVREDNPAQGVRGPDRGASQAKEFLYPSEAERFLASDEPPLRWRLAVALACYTYLRVGELRVLQWSDIDLEHAVIHVRRAFNRVDGTEKPTKGRRHRSLPIEPTLRALLRKLHESTGGRGLVLELPSERDMSRGLKRWLRRAGVTRPLRADAHRRAITFHDLRGTGITWMAVRGDDALKIRQRAGHEDQETTDKYIRLAEVLRGGEFGEPFPAIPEGLLSALAGADTASDTASRERL